MDLGKRFAIACCLTLASCNKSNNLLLGRVEENVGGHRVIVTDCYRTSVPASQSLGGNKFRFMPCRDADVLIQKGYLSVNGQPYGHIKLADAVLVDHGIVSVLATTKLPR